MSTQALATRGEQPLAKNDIRNLLRSESVRDQIQLALPKHMDPDRMMRVALTAINKNPKLLECTQESILLSLMTCSQYGIEPDGRNAHLIPYRNSKKVGDNWETTMECQFQWDYKGLVAQVRKSSDVKDIYADYICEKDTYKVTRGLHRDLIHEFDIAADRGQIIAFYSVCLFKDGTASFEIMTIAEVEDIRLRSKSTDKKTGKSTGPWLTDYSEMGKKTVIKRHSKLLPLPTEIALALQAEKDFDEIPAAQVTEIKQAKIPDQHPALPESSQEHQPNEQEQQPVSEPEPTKQEKPADKPAPARGKKLGKAAGAAKEQTPADKVLALVVSKGFSKVEFIKACVLLEISPASWGNNDLDPESLDVAELGNENIELLLDPDNEEQLADYLTQARGELTK